MDFKKGGVAILLAGALIFSPSFQQSSYAQDGGADENASGGSTEFLDVTSDMVDDSKTANTSSNFKAQEIENIGDTSSATINNGVGSPFDKFKGKKPEDGNVRQVNSDNAPDFSANAGGQASDSGGVPQVNSTSVQADKMTAWNFLTEGMKNKNREDLEKAADLYGKLVFSSSRQDGKFLYFLARCFEELSYVAKGEEKTKMLTDANKLFKESAERLKAAPDATKCVSYKDAVDKSETVTPENAGSSSEDGAAGGSGFGGLKPVEHRVTSEFGMRTHPVTGGRKMHKGIDFGCPRGTKPKAIGAGKVVFAGWVSGYGNTNVIEHVVGGKKYYTRYAHLTTTAKVGTSVQKGQVVPGMTTGNTGIGTGPHLHFEVRIGNQWGEAVNPRRYFGALAK